MLPGAGVGQNCLRWIVANGAGLFADLHQPAPVTAEIVVGPVEVRVAVRAHIREVGITVGAHPRCIGDSARMLPVGLKGRLHRLTPLTLGDFAVGREFLHHLVKGAAVAERDPLETTGLCPCYHLTLGIPSNIVAVAANHLERLIFRRVEIEREFEDFVVGIVRTLERSCHAFLLAQINPGLYVPDQKSTLYHSISWTKRQEADIMVELWKNPPSTTPLLIARIYI